MFEARIRELGIELGDAPSPAAAYVPARRIGDLVYTSGSGANRGGVRHHVGRVGSDVSLEDAQESARLAALNCLAAARSAMGSLDAVDAIVKVVGYVRSAPDFDRQHLVVNGASELLFEIFDDAGRHARAAVGVNELPFGISVEIEMIIAVKEGA